MGQFHHGCTHKLIFFEEIVFICVTLLNYSCYFDAIMPSTRSRDDYIKGTLKLAEITNQTLALMGYVNQLLFVYGLASSNLSARRSEYINNFKLIKLKKNGKFLSSSLPLSTDISGLSLGMPPAHLCTIWCRSRPQQSDLLFAASFPCNGTNDN